jgi:hypothetical protein
MLATTEVRATKLVPRHRIVFMDRVRKGFKMRLWEKAFRGCDLNQPYLLPPSLQDWLPEGHLVRFVA